MAFTTLEKAECDELRKLAFDSYCEDIFVYSKPLMVLSGGDDAVNFAYGDEVINNTITKTYTPVLSTIQAVVRRRDLITDAELSMAQQDARYLVGKDVVKINVKAADKSVVEGSIDIVINGISYAVVAGPVRRKMFSGVYYDFWLQLGV